VSIETTVVEKQSISPLSPILWPLNIAARLKKCVMLSNI